MIAAPSMNALFLTGLLILFIFVLVFMHIKDIMKIDYYKKIVLLCVLTVAIGIHGVLHLGSEVVYGFNPYKWI